MTVSVFYGFTLSLLLFACIQGINCYGRRLTESPKRSLRFRSMPMSLLYSLFILRLLKTLSSVAQSPIGGLSRKLANEVGNLAE